MADLVELTAFIVRMSENPEQARRFREEPNAGIAEAGLSGETRRLLTSGPREFTRDVLAAERRAQRSFGVPTLGIPLTQSNVETAAHVITNTEDEVTTHTIVAIEYEYE